MQISELLAVDNVKVFLGATTKRAVIEELCAHLTQHKSCDVAETVLAAVLERENIATTGIGNGVAIPHARLNQVSEIELAVGLCKSDIDFESIDDEPVRLICLILCPESEKTKQLQLLARLSRLLHDHKLRDKLLSCTDAEALKTTFVEYENEHFG